LQVASHKLQITRAQEHKSTSSVTLCHSRGSLVPAKAGSGEGSRNWIPACAGMTIQPNTPLSFPRKREPKTLLFFSLHFLLFTPHFLLFILSILAELRSAATTDSRLLTPDLYFSAVQLSSRPAAQPSRRYFGRVLFAVRLADALHLH